MPRRQYLATAKKAKLTSDITASPTQIPIDDATGYPSGTTPFIITHERENETKEERKLVTRGAGSNLLDVVTNGFEGTAAQVHLKDSSVEHTGSATDFDEANRLVNLADAKGDIPVATGADAWARKPAPADGQLFVAGAAEADGWKPTTGTPDINAYLRGDGTWGPVVSADALNALSRKANGLFVPQGIELIDEQILIADTAQVDFTSIPQTFKSLMLIVFGKSSAATPTFVLMRFNDNLTSTYLTQSVQGSGASVTAERVTATGLRCGAIPGQDTVASVFGGLVVNIPYYSDSVRTPIVLSQAVWEDTADAINIRNIVGRFKDSVAAITKISLLGESSNFKSGSSFALYGLRGE